MRGGTSALAQYDCARDIFVYIQNARARDASLIAGKAAAAAGLALILMHNALIICLIYRWLMCVTLGLRRLEKTNNFCVFFLAKFPYNLNVDNFYYKRLRKCHFLAIVIIVKYNFVAICFVCCVGR